MNSKRAKFLRKQVYGDQALRQTTYAIREHKGSKGFARQLILTPGSLRQKYQALKEAYKQSRKEGVAACTL